MTGFRSGTDMGIKYFFTGDSLVTGFYNTEAHTAIPEGATECTQEERDAAIEAEANGKILCITDGKISPQDPPSILSFWNGTEWAADVVGHNRHVDELRLVAYREESDPLFFKESRGEVPVGTSAAKVAEIRARYPKIGE